MKHISEIIEDILVEWAYRVHDGMPNPTNPQHIIELRESMEELNLPNNVIYEVIENLINEVTDEETKFKARSAETKKIIYFKNQDNLDKALDSGTAIAFEKDNGGEETETETTPPMKIDANPFDNKDDEKEDETDDEKSGEGELNGVEYLQSLDIEVPEGLSDEEIQSIAKTEKTRRDFLVKTIDLMISQVTQQRKGKGTNDLTQEEWQNLKDFTEGKGPKTPPPTGEPYNITEDDIDDAIEEIKKKPGGSKLLSALGKKGAAGKGANDTTRKWIPNPDYDSSKPAGKRGASPEENPKVLPGPGLGRERKVLKSFLMTGGLSVVTGKPLSIGSSELDHRLSLDNGGKDEPDNWVWMESRFNQQKSKLSDGKLIEKADKWLSMDPKKLSAKKKKDLITNESNDFAISHWKGIFEKGGNGGINTEMLNSLTIPDTKNIIKAWNKANPDSIIQYYHAGDGNRTRGEFVGKKEMIKRAIEIMNKKEPVMTGKEIKEANKVLEDALDEIKNRERDIKV